MKTIVTTTDLSLNQNVPVVHSISGYRLEQMGFIKFGTHFPEGSQSIITTYKRGEEIIEYNGVGWVYNKKVVEFIEDLPQ